MPTDYLRIYEKGYYCTFEGHSFDDDARIRIDGQDESFRSPTKEERLNVEIERIAASLIDKEIYLCDTPLIDKLMGKQVDGFEIERCNNLRINTHGWSVEQAIEYLEDLGVPLNDDDDEAILTRAKLIASENLQEPLEWWRISAAMAQDLNAINEVILDNDFGYWWGRTATGQSIICDGVIQKIARTINRNN